MIFRLILVFLLPIFSSAIIPTPCTSNVTDTPAICCPTPLGHKNPCGYPKRGRCAMATSAKVEQRKGNLVDSDIRMEWPTRVFQYVCKCVGKYWGVACEGCQFGYEGEHCQHKVVNKRRNVMTYTKKQKHQLVTILNAAHHVHSGFVWPDRLGYKDIQFRPTSIYENAVYTHCFAARHPIPVNRHMCVTRDLNHNTLTFILWHRYILMWWERQMREMAREKFGWKNFTLPYWDYTNKNSCEVCTADFICTLGKSADHYQIPKSCQPIATWKIYCVDNDSESICNNCSPYPIKRRLKRHFKPKKNVKAQFITAEEFKIGLGAPVFGTNSEEWSCGGFAEYIESGCACLRKGAPQMHNLVHNIFAEDMASTTASPNDPLFFFHHSQLDRLLHRWIMKVKPNASQIPVESRKPYICRDCNLVGFLPTVTGPDMLRDLSEMGITYDNLDFGPLKEEEKVPVSKSLRQHQEMTCNTDTKQFYSN